MLEDLISDRVHRTGAFDKDTANDDRCNVLPNERNENSVDRRLRILADDEYRGSTMI